ncbi:MAG: hypothetical protein LBJ59_02645 [Zoogloeaceae bacterium]|jgi:hypothetical protein|nr:hypothetical protein [Zoogloeaceae bacterium]
MGKIYVYSTLSNDQDYAGWATGGNDLKKIQRSVLIRGKANLPDKHLITPLGVVTEITPEEEAFLRANKIFQLHEKNGFIRVDSKKVDVEKAVVDMERREPSAPDAPQDFVDAPTTDVVGLKRNTRSKKT